MSATSARAKNIMYTQQMSHLPAKTVDKLVDLIENTLQPKKYAVIVHDKDVDEQGTLKAAHVHVMLSFDNARSSDNVAKLLNDKSQYVEAWRGNAHNGYAYLVHATKDAQTQHQYDPSEVHTNFDYLELLQQIAIEVSTSKPRNAVKVLLDALYEGGITKQELENRLTGSQYGQYKTQIDKIWSKRLQKQAEAWRAEMSAQGKNVNVIFVYGEAGTGKTSLACEYAGKLERDYYIAGSQRDPFQNYAGERTLILDELRPTTIPYPDLLRILDPFGAQVMAPSRYSDKALACDLIIITSPHNPRAFYKEALKLDNMPSDIRRRVTAIDSFEQLQRRITLTIEMNEYYIHGVEFDPKQGYVFIPGTSRQNPYSTLNRPPPTANATDLYKSMFD